MILDRDLAALYGVPTFRFNEAVKRNRRRFPADFMFRLTAEEFGGLTSQIAMSKPGRGGRRTLNTADGNKISYDEFYVSRSKLIIDKIDRILAKHYGFTDEELDFIINYDIKYRMGSQAEDVPLQDHY